MSKVLALNTNGELTWCTAPPELRGKGRCNHIEHQRSDENTAQFMTRIAQIKIDNNPVIQDIITRNLNGYRVNSEDNVSINCNGVQAKYQKGNDYIKVDQDQHTNALCEEIVSQFLDLTNLDHAHYEAKAIFIDGQDTKENCAVSPSFFNENVECFRTTREMMDAATYFTYKTIEDPQEQFDYLVNFFEEKLKIKNSKSYLIKMLSLDCIIGNPDRHLNNFGVIQSYETGEYRFAPVFDHGLSLLSNFQLFPLDKDLDENIYRIPMSTFKSSS